MAIRLVLLGKLADLAGTPEREIAAPLDWDGLLAALAGDDGPKDDALAEAVQGERIRVALNGEVLADRQTLLAKDGDEIALLPPVSGG